MSVLQWPASYLVACCAAAWAVLGVSSVVLVVWGRRQRATRPSPYVVVPGCRVYADGQPSPALRRRVLHGVEVARRFGATLVITGTGGEAVVGAALALAAGLPADRVLAEPDARDTRSNAACSAALLGSVPVVVVSDDYHLMRCRRWFSARFPDVQLEAAPSPAWPWRASMRELIALVGTLQG